MKKEISTALRLSALSIALLAAGCGGGGGGGNSSGGSTAASTSVSGTAAKGIIKGGLVQVFAIDAQGVKGTTPVATGTTASDGTFTVSVPKSVLSFVVEVSATTGTVMADEATGRDLPMPTDLKLRNVVALSEATDSYTGAVSPLTEMAVKVAESAGSLTPANIQQAKAEMVGRFGFDPEAVKPVNMNSAEAANATDEQKKQALILAGISRMARDGDTSLGCAAQDLACVVTKVSTVSDGGSVKTLVDKLQDAANAAANDSTIENKTGTTTVQVPNKPAAPPATETPVASAKKLFASLRTNLNAIANSKTALEDRADLVAADFDKMIAPVDEELANWVSVSTAAIKHLNAYKAGQTSQNYLDMGDFGCTVFSDAGATAPASSAANALNIGCSLNRKFISWSMVGNDSIMKTAAHGVTITPDSGNVYKYISRARLETWVNGVRNPADDVSIGSYGSGTRATGTITYNQTDVFAIKGMMPARFNESGLKITDHETWDLNASISYDATAKVTSYALSSTMTSMLNGQEKGTISVLPGSVLRVSGTPDTLAATAVKEFSLAVSGKSGGSTISGAFSLTDWKHDKSKTLYAPAVASFSGSLTQGNLPFFSGELKYVTPGLADFDASQPASDTNFLAQTLRLSGKLAIPSRPALDMFLAVTPVKTGGFDLTAQYDDGTAVVNFSGKRAATGGLSSATISSSTGLSVSITQADLDAKRVVNVKKNGETAATINLATGVVNYADGEFESLK